MTDKGKLIAAIICWTIAVLTLAWALFGCASPKVNLAHEAEWQVRQLAHQVIDAPRTSQIDKVHAGETFRANCETYARTVADLLIEYGADPEEVWLVRVGVPMRGISLWDFGKGFIRMPIMYHMIVYYKGVIIDNRKPHITRASALNYTWEGMQRARGGPWYATGGFIEGAR